MFERLVQQGFEVECVSHAAAILGADFPDAIAELDQALGNIEIPITEIIGSGGGEAKATQRLRRALSQLGWTKLNFEIRKTVNGVERQSISHQVDHVRSFPSGAVIALEIEWNNKDPFFDRDLENFKRLHSEGAISAGVVITRGSSLQAALPGFVLRFAKENNIRSFDDLARFGYKPTARQERAVMKRVSRAKSPIPFDVAWSEHFVSDKYGEATTHWRKLTDRVKRGVGNPCPLALIGMPAAVVTFPSDGTLADSDAEPEADQSTSASC